MTAIKGKRVGKGHCSPDHYAYHFEYQRSASTIEPTSLGFQTFKSRCYKSWFPKPGRYKRTFAHFHTANISIKTA